MTSGKQARADRQAKIAAAAPKENKTRLWLGLALALVAILAVGTVIWSATRGSDTPAARAFPTGATGPDGGIVINQGGAKAGLPTVDVYFDFQCPYCKEFDAVLGKPINQLADSGRANVVYHIKTFLDDNLRNDSSKRAGMGAACAADQGKFQAYHDLALANQPAQEGTGYTDAQLTQFATQAGITGNALAAWTSCVNTKQYAEYLKKVEETTSRAGVTGTPTYRVNGQDVKFTGATSPADLSAIFTREFARITAGQTGSPGSAPTPAATATSRTT